MFDILWSYTDQMLSHRLLKHLKKLILACDMAIWSWGNLRLTSGPWKEAKLNFPSKIFIYGLILMFDPSKCSFWQTVLIYDLINARINEKSWKKFTTKNWEFCLLGEKTLIAWPAQKKHAPTCVLKCSLANFWKTLERLRSKKSFVQKLKVFVTLVQDDDIY